jgi:hypothetical protein
MMQHLFLRAAALTLVALFAIALSPAFAPSAHALDEQRGEEAAIKACDLRLCTILTKKDPKGEDLRCNLTKTWARSTIKEADSHKLSWNFGDAQCTVSINLSRARLVEVLTGDGRKFFVPPHTANCIVEQDGKREKVTATVSPKIYFNDGKAEKVWVNLTAVEGPANITATLKTAAYLADNLGLFHRRMIKSINKYIERHCAQTYPQLVSTSAPAASSPKPSKK